MIGVGISRPTNMANVKIDQLPEADYKQPVMGVAVLTQEGVKRVDLAEEKALAEILGEVYNRFTFLSPTHPMDLSEARFHIHALQNIVASRVAVKVGVLDFKN